MSFRILFADDSMTAQNMGKKILTDAGYDVVAVSNGAAAVKKIAEHKPDIIILDIYMPGYSGLEVCDKVRASVDTLKTPVLLTVGKMEPYKPEDANRVRADGVIIKPFEASDLLAVIKKLEERVVPKTIAMAQDTVLLERPPEFAEFEPPSANDAETNTGTSAAQTTVDVPDNMATTAAFSDMLGSEPAYSLNPLPVPKAATVLQPEISPEPPVEAPASPVPIVESAPAKLEETAVEAWPPTPKPLPSGQDEAYLEPAPAKSGQNGVGDWPAVAISTSAPPAQEEIAATVETAVEEGFAVAEPRLESGYHEPGVVADAPEIQTDPELEQAGAAVSAGASSHPGLAIDVVSFDQAPVQLSGEAAISAPPVAVAEVPPMEAEITKASAEEQLKQTDARQEAVPGEDDFEARVAAAMSIYDAPVEEKIEAEASLPEELQPATNEVATGPAPAISDEVTPSFEYTPPVSAPNPIDVHEAAVPAGQHFKESPVNPGPMLITTEATMVIPVYLEPPVEPKQEEPTAIPQPQSAAPEGPAPAVEQRVEAQIEAALPAATAAAATASVDVGADTQMITAVVDRILERLKPQMIEEIARELKAKK